MNEPRIQKLEALIDAGKTLISNALSNGSSKSMWDSIVAGESSRATNHVFKPTADSQAVALELQGKYGSQAQKAGLAILAAAADVSGWNARIAQESNSEKYSRYVSAAYGDNDMSVDYGRNDWRSVVGREYYSEKDLDKNLGLSWALNVRALETQSKFAETLYPTITVEGTDVGITVKTKITTVTRGLLNALLKEDVVEDNRHPLHWALSDHKILDDDAIRIVPYKMEDGTNAEFFVDDTIIEDRPVQLGRVPAYPTNFLSAEYLRTKHKINLFQLSAHPGIVQAGYDETDEVAPGASLGRFLIRVAEKGAADAAKQYFILNVKDMQFATFDRPQQGGGRELILNFRQTKYALSSKSTDHKNKVLTALAPFGQAGLIVNYVINMNASLFTSAPNAGKVEVTGLTLSIDSVIDSNGTEQPISGSTKSLVDQLDIDVVGVEFSSTRTNENRRSQGLMLDPIWEQENYKLQFGSPIMTKTPVNNQEYNDTERLDDLISAVNIRNELLAVGQTLAYSDQISQVYMSQVTNQQRLAIRGLGRHWVGAFYREDEFNVADVVQSLETKDALINARQALMQRIGDQVVTAIQETRYIQSLRLMIADPAAVPSVIIATDEPTAAMLLLYAGDGRLLGDRYMYEVITTNDDRWRVKNPADGTYKRRLQWFLKAPGVEAGSYCVLNWGNHFWSPIMVTNMNIQRNGATSKELAVQPRNAHINHCPITGVLWVTGITDLVAKKLSYSVATVAAGAAVGGSTAGSTAG